MTKVADRIRPEARKNATGQITREIGCCPLTRSRPTTNQILAGRLYFKINRSPWPSAAPLRASHDKANSGVNHGLKTMLAFRGASVHIRCRPGWLVAVVAESQPPSFQVHKKRQQVQGCCIINDKLNPACQPKPVQLSFEATLRSTHTHYWLCYHLTLTNRFPEAKNRRRGISGAPRCSYCSPWCV